LFYGNSVNVIEFRECFSSDCLVLSTLYWPRDSSVLRRIVVQGATASTS